MCSIQVSNDSATETTYEAVPRVVFTDPQAAAVGAGEARFSATVPVSQVSKTATSTRAYAGSNGFLTLLSDGERLTGAYAEITAGLQPVGQERLT
jgi:dihydrolipoamide dehydrogenase